MATRPRHVVLILAATIGCLTATTGPKAATASPGDPGNWTIQPSPNPADVTTSELTAGSCPGSQMCLAVGDDGNYSIGVGLTALSEEWDGSVWTIVPVPVPEPASADDAILSAISCSSVSSCMAVGYTVSASNDVRSLAERWDGSGWTIVTTPQPANSSWTVLDGVSCTARGNCIAVGGQIGPHVDSQELPLSMVWRGGTWRLRAVPNPHAENGSDLEAVSCTTLASCQATGGYAFADVAFGVFAAAWNGRHWTLEHQPNPAGGESSESAIACTSPSACLTVGSSVNAADRTRAAGWSWNGHSWALRDVPSPAGTDIAELFGLACAQAGDCVAVGDQAANYYDSPNSTLAENWDGSAWTVETTPDAPGAITSSLAGITCPSVSQCVAVGSSSGAGVTSTLVEVRDSSAG
jgi:hypothetical protein